jgi:bifunctional polynucleotide phosphatase/kinase
MSTLSDTFLQLNGADVAAIPSDQPFALFDFDHTLVKPKDGRRFPKGADDWQWLRPSVPSVVKAAAETHQVCIVTDQSKPWKVDMIRAALSSLDIPVLVVIGFKTKKPSTSFFLQCVHATLGLAHYYVGDAAGRTGDWSDSDKLFAANLGVEFRVPEAVFPMAMGGMAGMGVPVEKINDGGDVGVGGDVEVMDFIKQRVIMMVGYPASGKSTWIAKAQETHSHANLVRVDGDALKTQPKMLKEAERILKTGGTPVLDATHGTVAKRGKVIELAKKYGVECVCVWIDVTIDTAMDRNNERGNQGGAKLPAVAFYVYRKHFEAPSEAEGFVCKKQL